MLMEILLTYNNKKGDESASKEVVESYYKA